MQRSLTRKLLATFAVIAMALGASTTTAGATHTFPDVGHNTYYTQAVDWLAAQGITDGMGDTGNYEPFTIVNRAQMAVFLWRLAGEPTPQSMDHGFEDVDEGSWYEEAVAWLRETGITTGVGGGFADLEASTEYQPWEPVLRNQIVTFLWRYGGRAMNDEGGNPYPAHNFGDVPPNTFYELALRWAKAESITTGTGGTLDEPSNTFEPESDTIRAHMAALLHRFAGFPATDDPGFDEPHTRCPGSWGPQDPDPNNECPPNGDDNGNDDEEEENEEENGEGNG